MSDANSTRPFRIATRDSALAMWQARHVADLLSARGVQSELIPLVSGGDTDMRPIDSFRQVGVFTKRIQQALVDDEADVAVHSLKDLPTEPDPRFTLAAIPPRESVLDCLISTPRWKIAELPEAATVGTGSRRRAAQLLTLRRDLDVQPIRGNVQTRLAKLESGQFDAIVLAEAGLIRLQRTDVPRSTFSLDEMLPAPGQGALGIEVRSDDTEAIDALRDLDHRPTRAAVTAERKLLSNLHGGCLAPIAAYARAENMRLQLSAIVSSTDGSQRLFERASADLDSEDWTSIAEQLADSVSKSLSHRGANDLIQEQR